jgi:hypothetical protein
MPSNPTFFASKTLFKNSSFVIEISYNVIYFGFGYEVYPSTKKNGIRSTIADGAHGSSPLVKFL